MNILCLDTTTEYIVLSLKKGQVSDYYISEKGCKKHNSIILPVIDEFLTKNSLKISDIDVFGVAVGPGSFTGIRVGVATVNAFSLALDKKIVAVTTLELPVKGDKVMTLLDCKHGNYYCGFFNGSEVRYEALTGEEADKYEYEKIYMSGTYEKELLEKCVIKAGRQEFVAQAKPFYVKKSSAEIETGIKC